MSYAQRFLNILVVGAGLGGLGVALALQTVGHHVTVLDSVSEFAEAGAGIRLPPNSSRLLIRWGVNMDKMKKSTLQGYHFVRWQDASTITNLPFDNLVQEHGAPYYLVHRADLHAALLDAARAAGVQVLRDKKIIAYDFSDPCAVTDRGEIFTADLIIAADGIRSIARPLLTGREDRPRDTGDVAYRILLPAADLLADPALADLITHPYTTSWCGPDAHIVGYPIRDGELYNIVVCATARHDETTDETWIVKGDNSELCRRFADWEPRVRKLCALTGDFLKWRLCDMGEEQQQQQGGTTPTKPTITTGGYSSSSTTTTSSSSSSSSSSTTTTTTPSSSSRSLATWIHPSGKAVLLGDACHPMLPYLAQGAAQAFEDAAVLRQVLAQYGRGGRGTLSQALAAYEKIRMPRARLVQEKTREHQYILHIDDGEEQRERDRRMRVDGADNPIFWGDDHRRRWLFGHDAEILDKDGANWQSIQKPT